MNTKVIAYNLGVVRQEEDVVVSSRDVARVFGKEHNIVMRSIRNLECSKEFAACNFALGSYKDSQNQERPQYFMTKDGFAILAMGFTGKRAMVFKEAYIAEFNRMHDELCSSRKASIRLCPGLNDTGSTMLMIRQFIDECCLPSRFDWISRHEFYRCFASWCVKKEIIPPSQCLVSRSVGKLGYYTRNRDVRYGEGLAIQYGKLG